MVPVGVALDLLGLRTSGCSMLICFARALGTDRWGVNASNASLPDTYLCWSLDRHGPQCEGVRRLDTHSMMTGMSVFTVLYISPPVHSSHAGSSSKASAKLFRYLALCSGIPIPYLSICLS